MVLQDALAVVAGMFLAWFIIDRFRRSGLERTRWAYALLLASFPLYYFLFALFASENHVLLNEIIAGTAFFLIAYASLMADAAPRYALLALGMLLHAAYDVFHDHLFINDGIPGWWPAFCGSIDLVLGLFLLALAWRSLRLRASA